MSTFINEANRWIFSLVSLIMPIAFGILLGMLFVIVIWFRTGSLDGQFRKYKVNILVATFSVALISLILIHKFKLSGGYLNPITLLTSSVLLLRIVRLKYMHTVSRKRLNAMLAVDSLAALVFLLTFGSALKGLMSDHGLFDPRFVLGFPVAYALFCVYFLFNFRMIFPRRFKLGVWRLLAYSFPTGQKHNRAKSKWHPLPDFSFSEFILWLITLTAIAISFLLSYQLSASVTGLMIYTSVIVVLGSISILKGWWRSSNRKPDLFGLRAIIAATYLIVIFQWLLIGLHGEIGLSSTEFKLRVLRSAGYFTPLAIWIMNLHDMLKQKLLRRSPTIYPWTSTLRAIMSVSTSLRLTAFDYRSVISTKLMIVAAILLLYFVFPKSEAVFIYFGLNKIGGVTISELIHKFDNYSSQWIVPQELGAEITMNFIFGNQGVVLMFLVWPFLSMLGVTELSTLLKRIPNFAGSKIKGFFIDFHIPIFIIYFLPFTMFLVLVIPYSLSQLFRESAAILIGVAAFSVAVPSVCSLFLSLGYLVAVLINTNLDRDRINLNEDDLNDILKLPGIGRRLARRIMQSRTHKGIDELTKLRGLSHTTTEGVADFVKF